MFFFNQWHRKLGRKNPIVIKRVRENQALAKEASGFPQYCVSPSGGYSGFQVTGMIEGFFGGLKFRFQGFFLYENLAWVASFEQGFFGGIKKNR